MYFNFLFTKRYSDYLMLSRQFQKAIILFEFFLKKHLRFLDITIK